MERSQLLAIVAAVLYGQKRSADAGSMMQPAVLQRDAVKEAQQLLAEVERATGDRLG